jgi:fumarate hydratase class I
MAMTTIRENDFIQSVADALQYLSYYHPVDYIEHLGRAYDREQSPAAKDAIAQILTNSRMCAEGRSRSARTPASSTYSSRSG